MIPESSPATHSTARMGALPSRALATDLAADSADLLDVSAALGIEFCKVVEALLSAPSRSASSAVRSLATLVPGPYPKEEPGETPPFVWVSLVRPGRRSPRIVRAGWLVPAAVEAIAAEARAAGGGTEIHVIVPLDDAEGTAARVRGLCAAFPPDLKLTIDVQREEPAAHDRSARPTRGPRRRSGGGAGPTQDGRHDGRFRTGRWIVLDPIGATS
jgi:hypothetical protein